ncbi:hypothetical protein [Burkholderia vietnamiensis]|uniref:hypothetical protein n=1 Tax=Burkholderia vietnamiensis TaxID=60552 RepID=UPI000AEE649C|nr:hypothetical protein [Burkholderia vietnamiensis]
MRWKNQHRETVRPSRLRSVRHANHIIAMDKGRIVEKGTHETLLQKRGYYAHLVALQNA